MSTRYRIRYRENQATLAEGEAVVEANSPTEALVKFRHACPPMDTVAPKGVVTSICAEDYGGDGAW